MKIIDTPDFGLLLTMLMLKWRPPHKGCLLTLRISKLELKEII
jgi:hypothetical protein